MPFEFKYIAARNVVVVYIRYGKVIWVCETIGFLNGPVPSVQLNNSTESGQVDLARGTLKLETSLFVTVAQCS